MKKHFNSFEELINAVDSGTKVFWNNPEYSVYHTKFGYMVVFDSNGFRTALFDDPVKMTSDFNLNEFYCM